MRDPDFAGIWYAPNQQDGDFKSSLFLYYVFRKAGVPDLTKAVVLDSLGLATVDNAIITPDKVEFTKEYLSDGSYGNGRVMYSGRPAGSCFTGRWSRMDDGHKSEGDFSMADFGITHPYMGCKYALAVEVLRDGVDRMKKKLELALIKQDRFRNWLQIE